MNYLLLEAINHMTSINGHHMNGHYNDGINSGYSD